MNCLTVAMCEYIIQSIGSSNTPKGSTKIIATLNKSLFNQIIKPTRNIKKYLILKSKKKILNPQHPHIIYNG